MKKAAVLEPVHWLQNGEITRTCMRKGNLFNFFFFIIISAAVSVTCSIWYQGHPLTETSAHCGQSGPGVAGCKSLGIDTFAPTAWLTAERAWIGDRSSEGKSFILCPCVSHRRTVTSAASLEAQSSLAMQVKEPGCELWLCYLSFMLLLG